ncbi:hypothetical protein [Companilactobacillus versmoldensis]|uniref:DUF5067 domain-containing protein n=1 Tax=Companilactobacillus versmoldensis DSM 14857 = KCTC 3814 TaxID=1423815 RepID=A0A0R1SDV4_9LACO|nr:hypothetical protein [Companilactobacillus versmoldensis]KRL67228.1 hypothetical protein FC27_GL002075 [Companilactobacillus versmoldensis DSM 14857 = KCTC 3814]
MKKSLFVVGLASLLVLTGCSTNNGSSSKTSNSDTEKVSKVDSAKAYQKLSDNDKKDVKFEVKKDNDKDNDLTLTIRNNTKKDVKFNQAKFSLMQGDTKKASSVKKGSLIIKAGQEKVVDELFEDISDDILNDGNLNLQYMNGDNVVAQIDLGEKPANSATSQPDTNTDTNQAPSNVQTDTSADNTQTTDSSNDTTDQPTASQDTSNRVVNSPEQAIQMYKTSNGDQSDSSGWTATEGNGGFTINTDSGTAFVSYNGDVTGSNGGTKSYSDYQHVNGN